MSRRRGHHRIEFLAAIFVIGLSSNVCAQLVGPVRGVIWTPPETFSEIRNQLERMADFGVQAVRVDLVDDENVYMLTELFEIALFQEIDLTFAPAEVAVARMDELVTEIDSTLQRASGRPGPFYLGLGYWNDTTDERTCSVLEDLAHAARQQAPGIKTYYTTPFIEHDRCSDAVDFVLIDSKGHDKLATLIERWRDNHSSPVGIAALGAPIRHRSGSGYLESESPEAQARFLESALSELLVDRSLAAVFVDRWADTRRQGFLTTRTGGDFGIIDYDGSPRPSAAVVKGFYTGNQQVFAFPAGHPSAIDYSWINLIAFVTAALFGFTFYTSLGLQSVLRRYFLSHSFYLEKVGDGREASVGISLFLLACLSIAASIVGTTLVTELRFTNLWFALAAWLPESISWMLSMGARYQVILLAAFGAMFALVALLWALVLSWLTPTTKKLRPAQTLLLAVIPRWPVAIIGLLILVVLNWQLDAPIVIIAIGTGVWLSVVIGYTGRMLSDYLRLLGITALLTIPVLFLALLLLAATGWLMVATQNLGPELAFLLNLATKT